jgi:hypothetical protein
VLVMFLSGSLCAAMWMIFFYQVTLLLLVASSNGFYF